MESDIHVNLLMEDTHSIIYSGHVEKKFNIQKKFQYVSLLTQTLWATTLVGLGQWETHSSLRRKHEVYDTFFLVQQQAFTRSINDARVYVWEIVRYSTIVTYILEINSERYIRYQSVHERMPTSRNSSLELCHVEIDRKNVRCGS